MRPELQSVLRLEVPIIVQIGRRTMSVESVVSLTPGSIIEFPKSADEELELLVNNKPIGAGIAVKVGENFGIRISYVGDLRARIAALGPQMRSAPAGPAAAPGKETVASESPSAPPVAPPAAIAAQP